jgi:hypothetical protein
LLISWKGINKNILVLPMGQMSLPHGQGLNT